MPSGIIELMLLIALVALGAMASVSDIRKGIIPNRLLFVFAVTGIALDIIYYGACNQDMILLFVMNLIVTTAMCMALYFAHSIAGGDCKLILVMAMLYPADFYLAYGEWEVTLFATILLSIFYGYVYMLILAAWRIISGETRLNVRDATAYMKSYLKSYLTAFVYVTFVNLFFALIDRDWHSIASWMVWVACIATAWMGGRVRGLKKPIVLLAFTVADIFLSIYMRILPFSNHVGTYIFTAVLVICQMTIRTNVYETIPTISVKKGMILSAFTSVAMQGSRIKGLPGISSEDLRDRLTEEEAESIRKWGRMPNGHKEIVIVKKIPFGIFITLGYLTYFLTWGLVK